MCKKLIYLASFVMVLVGVPGVTHAQVEEHPQEFSTSPSDISDSENQESDPPVAPVGSEQDDTEHRNDTEHEDLTADTGAVRGRDTRDTRDLSLATMHLQRKNVWEPSETQRKRASR